MARFITDDYGDEIVVATLPGHVVSMSHALNQETAFDRSGRGLNYRGPIHWACARCQLVWIGAVGDAPSACIPHEVPVREAGRHRALQRSSAIHPAIAAAWPEATSNRWADRYVRNFIAAEGT